MFVLVLVFVVGIFFSFRFVSIGRDEVGLFI